MPKPLFSEGKINSQYTKYVVKFGPPVIKCLSVRLFESYFECLSHYFQKVKAIAIEEET